MVATEPPPSKRVEHCVRRHAHTQFALALRRQRVVQDMSAYNFEAKREEALFAGASV